MRFFCTILLLFCFFGSNGQQRWEKLYPQMGTVFRMVFYEKDSEKAEFITAMCEKRLNELNLVMSDYRSDSEVMQLCTTYTPERWNIVSNDLINVLQQSQRAAKLTNGLFDVTISPLSKLWRRTRRLGKLPSQDQIDDARETVDFRNLEVDSVHNAVRFLKPAMRLDFGGIGKGFALDELMKIFQENGIRSVMLEAGGSILLGESPPEKNGWEININERVHVLKNCGISTSGDRFQFVEIDGKRYAHILDPRTGFGFHKPWEVTLVAPNASAADWASTAAYLMNENQLKSLLLKTGIKIIN